MKKIINAVILAAVSFMVAYHAEAACVSSDCDKLGFTKSVSECGGQHVIKCPFDESKVFCGGNVCADGYVWISGNCVDACGGCPTSSHCVSSCVPNGCTSDAGCAGGYTCVSGTCQPTGTVVPDDTTCYLDSQCSSKYGSDYVCIEASCWYKDKCGGCPSGKTCITGMCV